jgi:hypothetical protein
LRQGDLEVLQNQDKAALANLQIGSKEYLEAEITNIEKEKQARLKNKYLRPDEIAAINADAKTQSESLHEQLIQLDIAHVQAQNKVKINATKEGTQERIAAEIAGIGLEQAEQLKSTKITADQKLVIVSDNEAKIRALLKESRILTLQDEVSSSQTQYDKLSLLQETEEAKNQLKALGRLDTHKRELLNAELLLEQNKYDLLIAQNIDNDARLAQLKEEHEKNNLDIKKKYGQEGLNDEKAISDAKIAIARSTVDGLGQLSNILLGEGKKSEGIRKALALAQIGIDEAEAIGALIAYSNTAATATGPAAPFVAAAYYASGIVRIITGIAKARQLLGGGGTSTGKPALVTGEGGNVRPPNVFPNATGTKFTDPEESRKKTQSFTIGATLIVGEMTEAQKNEAVAYDRARRKVR